MLGRYQESILLWKIQTSTRTQFDFLQQSSSTDPPTSHSENLECLGFYQVIVHLFDHICEHFGMPGYDKDLFIHKTVARVPKWFYQFLKSIQYLQKENILLFLFCVVSGCCWRAMSNKVRTLLMETLVC